MHPCTYVALALTVVVVTFLAVWVATRADIDVGTMISESEMAAYRARQKNFGVADAVCFAKAIADLDRPWLLLGGDSNWRQIFHRMIEQFEKAGVNAVARAALSPPKLGCDIRWFDDDAICCRSPVQQDLPLVAALRMGPRQVAVSTNFASLCPAILH
jgi:hypothetical protein